MCVYSEGSEGKIDQNTFLTAVKQQFERLDLKKKLKSRTISKKIYIYNVYITWFMSHFVTEVKQML